MIISTIVISIKTIIRKWVSGLVSLLSYNLLYYIVKRSLSLTLFLSCNACRGASNGMIRADSEASVETLLGEEEAPPPKQVTPLLKRLFCNARDVTRHFDATVWMGDLNYRLEGSRQAIEFAVKQGRFQVAPPSLSALFSSPCLWSSVHVPPPFLPPLLFKPFGELCRSPPPCPRSLLSHCLRSPGPAPLSRVSLSSRVICQ